MVPGYRWYGKQHGKQLGEQRGGTRDARRRAGLLAVVFAFLLQAVAWAHMPLTSVSQRGEVVTLCTSTGVKTMPLAQFEAQAEQGHDWQDHGLQASGGLCVLCPLMHGLAMPPSAASLPPADLAAHAPPRPPAGIVLPDRFLASHQARAPPSLG